MLAANRARASALASLLGCALGLTDPAAFGQIRAYAKVDPNAAATNGSADVYAADSGVFTPAAAAMSVARELHAATLLQDGKVLVTGGYNGGYLATAELYDPDLSTFTATSGEMKSARAEHTVTTLPNGHVLVVGGTNGSTVVSSAEIYDPSEDTFTDNGNSPVAARSGHTATLLSDGTVLIVGGYSGSSYLNSAEIYDPDDGTFKYTGSMKDVRSGHTATLLSDGRVLIAGGRSSDGYLNSAEIYDPSTEKFTSTSAMTTSRRGHSATLMSNGKVLVAGGFNGSPLNSAEVFDTATGKFMAISGGMIAARWGHAAVLLSTGKVLVTGGCNDDYLASAELFDPAAGTFASSPSSMAVARQLHTATLLSDGRVLLAGGLKAHLLTFDVNLSASDNIAPNIVMSNDSRTGFVAYTGSGVVVAFSTLTGEVLKRIQTGGYPASATSTPDGKTLAVVSVLDSRVFLIDMEALTLKTAYSFDNALFGFGSIITLSPDGQYGYISSAGTGEVLKFSMSNGQVAGRLKGLEAPAQITVTPDGATLLVVDVTKIQLVFVDAESMTRKSAIDPRDTVSSATLSMYNKAVLDPTGTFAVLAVRSAGGSGYSGSILVFKVPSGQILFSGTIGSQPGFTGLRPNGKDWVILNESSISLVTVNDPGAKQEISTAQGYPLGSANIAFSTDSTYAYYVSSTTDLVFQHNLSTQGVVGQVLIGDSPNKGLEQPVTVAIARDGKTVAALEFIGNTVDLLKEVTALEGTKFVLSGNQFSGVSLLNLSNQTTTLTVYALDNYGQVISADDLVNPVRIELPANGQYSGVVSELFNFDTSTGHSGRLEVFADQPRVAGYISVGQITGTWFGYYLSRMDGSPMFSGQLYDWIIPEVATASEQPVLFDVVSSNYTQQTYALRYYSQDGTLAEEKASNTAYPTNRTEQAFSDLFTSSGTKTVLITGGQNDNSTVLSSAEKLNTSGLQFSSTRAMNAVRYNHSATLLFNQKVLIAGGENSSAVLDAAEVYDISEGSFTETGETMTTESHRSHGNPPSERQSIDCRRKGHFLGNRDCGTVRSRGRHFHRDCRLHVLRPDFTHCHAAARRQGTDNKWNEW